MSEENVERFLEATEAFNRLPRHPGSADFGCWRCPGLGVHQTADETAYPYQQ